ncbi:MAG: zinc ribbon domain-containing protein, partial [Acidimicrobiales bacterium]
ADAQARRDEVASRQAALEAELAATEERATTLDKRLYSGAVTATRDLMAMQHEIAALKQRASALEDTILETLDVLEPLDAEVAGHEADGAAIGAEAVSVRAVIVAAEIEIDAALVAEQAARDEMAADVPAELGSTYELLRARLGGVGAARLVGPSCSGCHLVLPATALDQIRRQPADAVVFCEQCGRILVR